MHHWNAPIAINKRLDAFVARNKSQLNHVGVLGYSTPIVGGGTTSDHAKAHKSCEAKGASRHLGRGFAGLAAARELERCKAHSRCDITLINAENYTLYASMLPEVATGSSREPSRRRTDPRRSKAHALYHGEVESIDLRGRCNAFYEHTWRILDANRLICTVCGVQKAL
ncbi:MAG: hypothetical protein DLM53_03350 [Candidatus Eremiobacter antarcticus]|nr:MAG: hypothetical protein DLM53_03350 [Candidatus Eremiobacter sp. RRmetagenome_bin22]